MPAAALRYRVLVEKICQILIEGNHRPAAGLLLFGLGGGASSLLDDMAPARSGTWAHKKQILIGGKMVGTNSIYVILTQWVS